MKIEFDVHRVSEQIVHKNVEHEGETLRAEVKALEVELTTVADDHGTLTLRFLGSAVDAASKAFPPGKRVAAEFSIVEE